MPEIQSWQSTKWHKWHTWRTMPISGRSTNKFSLKPLYVRRMSDTF